MAILFLVKDGPRPDNLGPGYKVRLANLYSHISPLNPMFVGAEPPTFNPHSPTKYPARVVVEVQESEVDEQKFEAAGFYLLKGIAPNDVKLSYLQGGYEY